jgi:SnoaL-like domain
MSAEDVEMVLSIQLAGRADAATLASSDAAVAEYLAAIRDLFDPDFECTMRFPGLNPVRYRGGVGAFEAAWRDRLKHWAEYRIEVEGVIDADERIFVFHRAWVRQPQDLAVSVLEVASLWTVRNHLLVTADFNVPQAEARAASPDDGMIEPRPRLGDSD